MSTYKVCRPKVRTTFRRNKKCPGNRVGYIVYSDPNMKWKLARAFAAKLLAERSKNAVLMEKKG